MTGPVSDRRAEAWAANRGRMFAVAYQLLGSVADAEDVIQDAYLRLLRVDPAELSDPQAWLVRVVTRLALDELRAGARGRETYVGPWLPEPLLTAPDPAEDAVASETICTAYLTALEVLTPAQRAALVLHDVFGYPYAELAELLERSETACRHLVSRARRDVRAATPRFHPDAQQRRHASMLFLEAVREGDVGALERQLADDALARTDGGGRARAARRPVAGANRVARLVVGALAKRGRPQGTIADVNGLPGLLLYEGVTGAPYWVLSLSVDVEGRISTIDIVTNPDKLRHLAPHPSMTAGRSMRSCAP